MSYKVIDVTEEELEALVHNDKQCIELLERKLQHEAKILELEQRRIEIRDQIAKLRDAESELHALLKHNDGEQRSLRGADTSTVYNIRRAKKWVSDLTTKLQRRRKQLYVRECEKKINMLGNEIRKEAGTL